MVKKVIGEGAYGCVHNPSLHCSNETEMNQDKDIYKNSVSKFMTKRDAENELNDFVVISSLDKSNQYHLGLPKICTPNYNDPDILNDISKCRYFNKKDVMEDTTNYKLLILKYGGPDLKNFCTNYLKTFLQKDKFKNSILFWKEVTHLLEGLLFFKKNGIVHYDIKPQNILFSPTNNRMVFIDFGLMIRKGNLMDECLTSQNKLGAFHWSYPFDNGFSNIDTLNRYNISSKKNKKKFQKELTDLIVFDSKKNTLNIPIRKPKAFKILFSLLDLHDTIPSTKRQVQYIDSFFKGFNEMIKNNGPEEVINHTIDTIDVFGLGFTLQYVLNCFYLEQSITHDFFHECSELFGSMYQFNPMLRELSIETILTKYQDIFNNFEISYTNINVNKFNHVLHDSTNDSIKPVNSHLKTPKSYDYLANLDATDVPLFHSKTRKYNNIRRKKYTRRRR